MIETQEMIAILVLVIVAVFVIVVGFDCIKDGMCDIGAVIHRCVSDDRRTSRWPDSIHNGNCGIHGRNRGQSISGIHKVSGY